MEAATEARAGSGWYAVLARTGLTAKGVSYALVGGLAIGVAIGVGGATTSREGALHRLAGAGFGSVLLVLLGIGLAAYAAWRFVQAIVCQEDEGWKTWGKRAGYAARGAVYAALAWSAVRFVLGAGGSESQTKKAHKTTAEVLSWPGGRWLVGAAGVVFVGAALWNLYRGLSKKFEDKWVARTGAAQTWGGRAGVAGHAARFVVFGLIGWFAIKAAYGYDPQDAVGLDGALQRLANESYGQLLLGVTAAGLVAYAIYCFVDARYRDVSA
jgi:Domain of Unknown Function (DUF1206)